MAQSRAMINSWEEWRAKKKTLFILYFQLHEGLLAIIRYLRTKRVRNRVVVKKSTEKKKQLH